MFDNLALLLLQTHELLYFAIEVLTHNNNHHY